MFTLHLQTDYGYKFAFHFAPLPLRLPARPALYAFWRDGPPRDRLPLIYVGETGDLSTRFARHHKAHCIAARRPTHIGICYADAWRPEWRKAVERGLIRAYGPPCNDRGLQRPQLTGLSTLGLALA